MEPRKDHRLPEAEEDGGRGRPRYTNSPDTVIPSNPSDQMAPTSDSRTQQTPSENSVPTLVQASPAAASPVEMWVHRSWIVIYVVFCIWIGIVVAALPWFNDGRAWTDNAFAMAYPELRAILKMNFVRGVVTGVGLMNIWLGVWEAVHYREQKS
jgi:hypothetical protein